MIRRTLFIAMCVLAGVFLWPIDDELVRQLPSWLLRRSPHDWYVRAMRSR